MKIEGLLMNSRMVQGIFDDFNPQTRDRWKYPDTGKWDADRNTREFIAAMPEWRRHGLLSFTINLQGGSPEGYSKGQPWHNSAFDEEGNLRSAYSLRLSKILDRADELGLVPIVGCFYFGQDQRLKDEDAVRKAVSTTSSWLLDNGYRNVLLEISNECDNKSYDHAILWPDRMPELLQLAKSIERRGSRLLVGASFNGGRIRPRLEPLYLGANFTYTYSRVKETAMDGQVTYRALQGQSPYVVNAEIGYRRGGTQLSLLYNVFGRRIAEVGTGGAGNVYEEAFNRLDITLNQKLPRGLTFKVSGTNLLNQRIVFRQGDKADSGGGPAIYAYRPGVVGLAVLEWSYEGANK
jgi:hypothetical protein